LHRLKFLAAAATIAAAFLSTASTAQAFHRRCGFDPYGYHAPDFRGCPKYVRRGYGRAYRQGWGFYPAYGFYPAGSYYALPRGRVYAVPEPVYPGYYPGNCYYDRGYDFRVRMVCVPAW
jgi:hypothetical protein